MDNSFYQRSGLVKDINRTYVPDLYRQCADELRAEEQSTHTIQSSRSFILQQRPIVGILFSISAGSDGEIFPLYIGRNIIGRDETSDICLREGTVSSSHATLLARKQFNEAGEEIVMVAIMDNSSTCGTKVNSEDINYDKIICKNGDIIKIGENYELLLSVFDVSDRLNVSKRFEHIEDVVKTGEEVTAESANINENEQIENKKFQYSDSTTLCIDSESEFYRPSRENNNKDHSNNKTILV